MGTKITLREPQWKRRRRDSVPLKKEVPSVSQILLQSTVCFLCSYWHFYGYIILETWMLLVCPSPCWTKSFPPLLQEAGHDKIRGPWVEVDHSIGFLVSFRNRYMIHQFIYVSTWLGWKFRRVCIVRVELQHPKICPSEKEQRQIWTIYDFIYFGSWNSQAWTSWTALLNVSTGIYPASSQTHLLNKTACSGSLFLQKKWSVNWSNLKKSSIFMNRFWGGCTKASPVTLLEFLGNIVAGKLDLW